MPKTNAKSIALGGVMAALAIVFMCLGGLIPIATFVVPMLCMLLLNIVLKLCGKRIAWAWYGAVALLSVLMGPDKEAAAVFAALGYYPIVKPFLDVKKFAWLWKAILFNAVILALYWSLMHIFGMAHLLQESQELGLIGTLITLVLGNVCFFMIDVLLHRLTKRQKRKRA